MISKHEELKGIEMFEMLQDYGLCSEIEIRKELNIDEDAFLDVKRCCRNYAREHDAEITRDACNRYYIIKAGSDAMKKLSSIYERSNKEIETIKDFMDE